MARISLQLPENSSSLTFGPWDLGRSWRSWEIFNHCIYISPLFNQCVPVIQQKNFMSSWISLVFYSCQKSHPGQVGSWNNFLKKPGQKLPPVDKLPWYHQLFWCFEMCSPLFLGRDSLSFSSYSTCLHQIQAELQHHVAYQRYTPPKTNMEPENGGPLEKEIPIGNHHFSGSMLNFRGVGVIKFYWNCQLQVKTRTSCTHLSLSTSGWIEMADPKPGPNRNIKKMR